MPWLMKIRCQWTSNEDTPGYKLFEYILVDCFVMIVYNWFFKNKRRTINKFAFWVALRFLQKDLMKNWFFSVALQWEKPVQNQKQVIGLLSSICHMHLHCSGYLWTQLDMLCGQQVSQIPRTCLTSQMTIICKCYQVTTNCDSFLVTAIILIKPYVSANVSY